MKDIAEALNITPATVSMALRDKACISESTRQRVKNMADHMGYQPDALVSQLMSIRRSGKPSASPPHLAWLTQYPEQDGWKQVTVFKMYQSAKSRAHARGYRLEPFWLHAPGMTAKRMRQILLSRNIRALLLPAQPQMNYSMDFPFEDFCVVAIGSSIENPGLNRVVPDFHKAAKILIKKVILQNFQRLGLIINTNDHAHLNEALEAETLLYHARYPERPHLPTHYYNNKLDESFLPWLNQNQPDVLLSVNAKITPRDELRINPPQPLPPRFWLNHYDLKNENLQGIDIQPDLVGSRSVDLLISLIQLNEKGLLPTPYIVTTPTQWHAGVSTSAS